MIKLLTEKILQKEMDRKAFLRNAGIAFGILTGITVLIGKLNLLGGETPKNQVIGYGNAGYGGSNGSKPVSKT